MESIPLTYGLVTAVTVYLALRWLFPPKSSLPGIPALTSTTPVLSLWGAIKNLSHNRDMVFEGYQKYKGRAFKIPEIFRWHVVITGPHMVDELRKAPDDTLSFDEATVEQMAMEWTVGADLMRNPWHIAPIRANLTKNLAPLFPEIREELVGAFNDFIPPTDNWVPVRLLDSVRHVVSRTSNRVFVGKDLCKAPEWIQLNIDFTVELFSAAMVINPLPIFMRPFVRPFVDVKKKALKRTLKHILPILKERIRALEESGEDYPGKPNDLISWLLADADTEMRKNLNDIAMRVLMANFAAIHTSSNSFGNALFRLASNSEWLLALRQEVEQVLKEEGWTKNALQKMVKVDSFLKESQRFDGLGSLNMRRVVLKDFTFSDGTFLPRGSVVSAAMQPMHHDEEVYPDPEAFNPWRFSDKRAQKGEEMKHQLVTTNSEYITFGHGRHACPGRFFAANELKLMMAHLVITYDLKLEKDGEMPQPTWFGADLLPSESNVLFRKRKD